MTFYGYKPYGHQRAVHNAMKGSHRSGKMFVVKSKRQVGKTTMAENILLEVSINHNETLSVLVEPTLDQSRRVYKEMVRAIQDTPILTRKNDSLLEIELANGSSILFKSAEQRDNLRGFTVTGILVIDECAFIQDDIFDILMPTTDVHSAPILLISTPKLKQGAFFRYYTAGLDPKNENIVSIDFNRFDTSFLLSPDRLEQYRKMMKPPMETYLGLYSDALAKLPLAYSVLLITSIGLSFSTNCQQCMTRLFTELTPMFLDTIERDARTTIVEQMNETPKKNAVQPRKSPSKGSGKKKA